jgi:hypothetical protein
MMITLSGTETLLSRRLEECRSYLGRELAGVFPHKLIPCLDLKSSPPTLAGQAKRDLVGRSLSETEATLAASI